MRLESSLPGDRDVVRGGGLIDDGVRRAAAELRGAIAFNEAIKGIVRLADETRLMATNAIFAGKRAGDVARGFGVLANELRDFSAHLAQTMQRLRVGLDSSADTASKLLAWHRKAARLREVEAVHPSGQAALERVKRRIAQAEFDVVAARRALQREVDEAVELERLGQVLARAAAIEAAYGGSFQGELTAVSQQFAERISTVGGALAELRKACRT